MQGKEINLKSEKYFDFFKMDKKNVQKKKVPIFYGNWKPLLPYFKFIVWSQKK